MHCEATPDSMRLTMFDFANDVAIQESLVAVLDVFSNKVKPMDLDAC